MMINYLKDRIKDLPHGSFGTYRGHPVVNIYYDPTDPSINAKNNKRYYLDSKNGCHFAPLISEYLELCKDLSDLQNKWDRIYKFKPRDISFPLVKKRKTIFDGDYFINAIEGK